METSGKQWVEIFSSPNPAQIAAVRSAFLTERVDFTVHGELTMALRGCVTPARVMVLRGQENRALALIKRMMATMNS
jgi:hypothetical protein